MRLKDRVAIITGGGQGIGASIAKRFASEGAAVVIVDVAEGPADQTAAEIRETGARADIALVDVTDKEQVGELVKKTLENHGKIDILINNAGITRDALAMRMSEEDWDSVIAVNLRGTWIPSQAVIRPMRKNKWGRIVNTASVAALGNAGQANYSTTKGGVMSLTKTLSLELASSKINVNCVAPGAIKTAMFDKVPEEMQKQYIERIPLSRFGKPEDVASAHVFLCSEDADYITGQTLFVDGGISVGM